MSSSLVFLVPLALVLGGTALAAFLWSLRSGQYEDLDGAAERILLDDDDDALEEGKAKDAPGDRDSDPGRS